jgi:hypothetical protein
MSEARSHIDAIMSWLERGGRLGTEDMKFLLRNVEKLDSMELISARDLRGLRDLAVLVKLCSQEPCWRCGNKRCTARAL